MMSPIGIMALQEASWWSPERIMALAALVGAVVTLIKVFYTPAQKSDVAGKWQELADKAADQAIQDNETIKKLRQDLDCAIEKQREAHTAYETLAAEVEELTRTMAEWQEGIEMLIRQLQAHNLEPVWRPRPRRGRKTAGDSR